MKKLSGNTKEENQKSSLNLFGGVIAGLKKKIMSSYWNLGKIDTNKNENTEQGNTVKRFRGIRFNLMLGFAVPILLIGVFGFISYQKSSTAIIETYEKSTTDTLKAVGDYLGVSIDQIYDKSVELLNNSDLLNYYTKFDHLKLSDKSKLSASVKEQIILMNTANDAISAISIFAEKGNGISTVVNPPQDIYTKFLDTEAGKLLKDTVSSNLWIGEHKDLDALMMDRQQPYAIALYRKMSKINGYLIMDMSSEYILETLEGIDLGNGSYIGFVTADQKETLAYTEEAAVFAALDYYKSSLASGEDSGYSYESYRNKEYLYIYSKVSDTGAYVCALVPKANIIEKASEIRSISFAFVAFAIICAAVIGTMISGSIGKAISQLVASISRAAKGDLTSSFETKRKDEFLILSRSLHDMMGGMSSLIGEVAELGLNFTKSAGELSNTSKEFLTSTKGISIAIEEIEKGVVQQAEDTEKCLEDMSLLSNKIGQVYDNTYGIEQIAKEAKTTIGEGIVIIDDLNIKSKATNDITQVVITDIEELELQSRNINDFISIINEIAGQTNLLSLNASIEAARAGEAGRGFAVVAGEIRKLAEQTVKASGQIQKIVREIQHKTKGTVLSTKQAEAIVGSQSEALAKTISIFERINNHVVNLVRNLENITIGIRDIEEAKESTLDAIRNISAISQQSATSSEEVSATAGNQTENVENLSKSAMVLAEDADKLKAAIERFRIH